MTNSEELKQGKLKYINIRGHMYILNREETRDLGGWKKQKMFSLYFPSEKLRRIRAL